MPQALLRVELVNLLSIALHQRSVSSEFTHLAVGRIPAGMRGPQLPKVPASALRIIRAFADRLTGEPVALTAQRWRRGGRA